MLRCFIVIELYWGMPRAATSLSVLGMLLPASEFLTFRMHGMFFFRVAGYDFSRFHVSRLEFGCLFATLLTSAHLFSGLEGMTYFCDNFRALWQEIHPP